MWTIPQAAGTRAHKHDTVQAQGSNYTLIVTYGYLQAVIYVIDSCTSRNTAFLCYKHICM